ncbi:F-box and associated interaction domains-containing protein putative isoform 1 [Tripterygium wilfordii]|uniref:F-box and associated interaction domains-containing protein putative isoform 1 n=1 Tax=Tripterygium wilfordii TaxID=458696 RepID=A0A7J7CGI0_TRIWF|nr:F-box/kelch-repeat protein At3g06240-like [Tripterygium wilfordii]KAF5733139.1 F-box and associated interaction domains-containing protein putative isoform 1 [Tripterygium wilfordii]
MAPMNLRDIPEDLVLDILTGLPVKALKRFRCVCKAWCDLFGNPDFINKHCIKQTILKNQSFFVNHYDETDECNSVISIFESDGDEVLNFTETIPIPFSEVFLNNPIIIGSCNGIVCVSDGVENIGFWNPATREYKPLPPLIPSIDPPVVPVDVHSNWKLGLGFDQRTKDYKILSFVLTYFEAYDVAVDEAQLYSLKNDSWREIPSFPVFAGDVVRGSICFKGDCYWLAYRDDPAYNFEDTPYILSFNMADEKFEKFELPDFGLSINDYILELGMFNGTLAVILYTRPGRLFDIWVMEEYGVTESWVKKWSIEAVSGLATISGLVWPLGFLRNYGVFFEDDGGQLVLYGKNSHVFKNLRLCGRKNELQVVKYVESLIPIDGRQ